MTDPAVFKLNIRFCTGDEHAADLFRKIHSIILILGK